MKKRSYDEAGQADLCARLATHYQTNVVTTKQVSEFIKANKLPYPYFLGSAAYKAGWGKYNVGQGGYVPKSTVSGAVAMELEPRGAIVKTLADNFIPDTDPKYVPFGFFGDLRGIIDSRIFYPVYITGLSGNGKTLMVDQVCAQAKRELIRVNITKETDENDLIGSYELVDGNTIWRDGPVVIAMRRGAILLLDETDYGSERLLCLQPVLEGKGYFNKKKGEHIVPAPGFNIMATANTKGKGSDDGRFIGANILNEAFLERFAITVEQEYPNQATELKILTRLFAELDHTSGMEVVNFATNLSKWAELIRKSHADGAVDEVISTRRLTHIAKAYCIFRNRRKAIEMCLNRFDTEVKTVYLDFYSKIDKDLDKKIVEPPTAAEQNAAMLAEAARKTQAEIDQRNEQARIATVTKTAQAARNAATATQASFNPVPTASKAAPPVSTTPAPALTLLTNTLGYETLSFARPLTIFGDARNVAAVAAKYKIAVSALRDPKTGGAMVKSHGITTMVNASDIVNAKGDLLDEIVSQHEAKVKKAMADMGDDVFTTSDDA